MTEQEQNKQINDVLEFGVTGEEYWLELFGDIYNILKDAGKRKALIFSKIKKR